MLRVGAGHLQAYSSVLSHVRAGYSQDHVPRFTIWPSFLKYRGAIVTSSFEFYLNKVIEGGGRV